MVTVAFIREAPRAARRASIRWAARDRRHRLASLIKKEPVEAGIQAFVDRMSDAAGRQLRIDQDVLNSETLTGNRNRAIAYLMRNFGSPHPEGYRKALRLMQLAEKFDLPIVCFVDTPGAYPGVGAEERHIAEAIAVNLREMMVLKTPMVAVILGEGGSGGALAIAVGDALLMLQYSTYSVISPEGCASILWKSAERAADAAETLGITANRLKTIGLIDRIVPEPLGGAHRDHDGMMQNLKKALLETWRPLQNKPVTALLEARFERLMGYGKFKEVAEK